MENLQNWSELNTKASSAEFLCVPFLAHPWLISFWLACHWLQLFFGPFFVAWGIPSTNGLPRDYSAPREKTTLVTPCSLQDTTFFITRWLSNGIVIISCKSWSSNIFWCYILECNTKNDTIERRPSNVMVVVTPKAMWEVAAESCWLMISAGLTILPKKMWFIVNHSLSNLGVLPNIHNMIFKWYPPITLVWGLLIQGWHYSNWTPCAMLKFTWDEFELSWKYWFSLFHMVYHHLFHEICSLGHAPCFQTNKSNTTFHGSTSMFPNVDPSFLPEKTNRFSMSKTAMAIDQRSPGHGHWPGPSSRGPGDHHTLVAGNPLKKQWASMGYKNHWNRKQTTYIHILFNGMGWFNNITYHISHISTYYSLILLASMGCKTHLSNKHPMKMNKQTLTKGLRAFFW